MKLQVYHHQYVAVGALCPFAQIGLALMVHQVSEFRRVMAHDALYLGSILQCRRSSTHEIRKVAVAKTSRPFNYSSYQFPPSWSG